MFSIRAGDGSSAQWWIDRKKAVLGEAGEPVMHSPDDRELGDAVRDNAKQQHSSTNALSVTPMETRYAT